MSVLSSYPTPVSIRAPLQIPKNRQWAVRSETRAVMEHPSQPSSLIPREIRVGVIESANVALLACDTQVRRMPIPYTLKSAKSSGERHGGIFPPGRSLLNELSQVVSVNRGMLLFPPPPPTLMHLSITVGSREISKLISSIVILSHSS